MKKINKEENLSQKTGKMRSDTALNLLRVSKLITTWFPKGASRPPHRKKPIRKPVQSGAFYSHQTRYFYHHPQAEIHTFQSVHIIFDCYLNLIIKVTSLKIPFNNVQRNHSSQSQQRAKHHSFHLCALKFTQTHN